METQYKVYKKTNRQHRRQNQRNRLILDGGLLVITNFGSDKDMKVIDMRNSHPEIKKLREDFEFAVGHLDMPSLNGEASEIFNRIRQCFTELINIKEGEKYGTEKS